MRSTRSVAAALLAVAVLATPAVAHPASDFYSAKWQRDRSVEWTFTNGVPSTDFRDRVRDGAGKWNALGPSMHFVKLSGDYSDFDPTVCPGAYQKNAVHRRSIDGGGGVLARTYTCVFAADRSELYSFQIVFDNGENWYNGTGDPGGSQFDTEGVAAHEFGHATGWSGHFSSSAAVCDPPDKATMCPTIEPGNPGARTLEEHDKHTFANAY